MAQKSSITLHLGIESFRGDGFDALKSTDLSGKYKVTDIDRDVIGMRRMCMTRGMKREASINSSRQLIACQSPSIRG